MEECQKASPIKKQGRGKCNVKVAEGRYTGLRRKRVKEWKGLAQIRKKLLGVVEEDQAHKRDCRAVKEEQEIILPRLKLNLMYYAKLFTKVRSGFVDALLGVLPFLRFIRVSYFIEH